MEKIQRLCFILYRETQTLSTPYDNQTHFVDGEAKMIKTP